MFPAVNRRRRAVLKIFAPLVLAGVGLIMARQSPARADLRVAASAPHAAQWRRLYERLPEAWKTGQPILLQEVSLSEMRQLVGRTGDNESSHENAGDRASEVDGCYQSGGDDDNSPPVISLSETLQGDDINLVFVHEYAHYVWDERLTRTQQAAYRKIWREQKRARRLITEYARESDEEGFAESVAYFQCHPGELRRRDPRAYQFLTDCVAQCQDAQFSAN